MLTKQTFLSEKLLTYSTQVFVNRTSKEQMHGYGTCATVVLIYSYSMNFIFLLVAFGFSKRGKKKKRERNLAAKQACAYFFFLLKRYFSLWF